MELLPYGFFALIMALNEFSFNLILHLTHLTDINLKDFSSFQSRHFFHISRQMWSRKFQEVFLFILLNIGSKTLLGLICIKLVFSPELITLKRWACVFKLNVFLGYHNGSFFGDLKVFQISKLCQKF